MEYRKPAVPDATRLFLNDKAEWLFAYISKSNPNEISHKNFHVASRKFGPLKELQNEVSLQFDESAKYILRTFHVNGSVKFQIHETETMQIVFKSTTSIDGELGRFKHAKIYSFNDNAYILSSFQKESRRFKLEVRDTNTWELVNSRDFFLDMKSNKEIDGYPLLVDPESGSIFFWTRVGNNFFKSYYIERHFFDGRPAKSIKLKKGIKGGLYLFRMEKGKCSKNYLVDEF